MNLLSRFCLISIFLLCAVFSIAQNKNPSKDKTSGRKSPVLYTKLGNYADSVSIPASDISSAIGLPLKVYDAKGNELLITYYQFYYKRKESMQDEETGKSIPVSTMVADHFTSTPLPKVWISNISEEFKKGEELRFFDIIVKSKSGDVIYAPDLKIIAQ